MYPNKMKYIAVGDIHGCRKLLEELLDKIPYTQEDCLVFLGDYTDRGDDSKGVIDYLINLKTAHPNCVFLRGNHDALLIELLSMEKIKTRELKWYLNLGGNKTLAQYGCPVDDLNLYLFFSDHVPDFNLKDYFPESHIEFLKNTILYYKTDDYFFVHAGINPKKDLSEQAEEDFVWIRGEFTNYPHSLEQTIIYGHSPASEARKDLEQRKIGIDTGAVYGGKLTALILPEMKFVSV